MKATGFLWTSRLEAEQALSHNLKPFADLLDEAFRALDDSISRLERLEQPFGRVCALAAIKARNLALGCYSLSLDSLAQEAGALFRPFLECLELLTYFRLDPGRIQEALEGRLPKAGIIAQTIEGKFKDLRDYLNAHASHLSMSPEAMRHLIDLRAGQLRPIQPYNEAVVRQNLRTLLAVLIWVAIEGVNCELLGENRVDEALANRVEDLKRRAFALFDQTGAH